MDELGINKLGVLVSLWLTFATKAQRHKVSINLMKSEGIKG